MSKKNERTKEREREKKGRDSEGCTSAQQDILEFWSLLNPTNDVSALHKNSKSPDFEASKL